MPTTLAEYSEIAPTSYVYVLNLSRSQNTASNWETLSFLSDANDLAGAFSTGGAIVLMGFGGGIASGTLGDAATTVIFGWMASQIAESGWETNSQDHYLNLDEVIQHGYVDNPTEPITEQVDTVSLTFCNS